MTSETETATPPPRSAMIRQLLIWACVTFLFVPPTIVIHELGHYAVAKAFRFPNVALHYGSVSDDAETAGLPKWKRGLKSAAGPSVTVILVLASCLATHRYGVRPLTVAPGFAAGVRSVLIGVAYLGVLATSGRPTKGGFDEAQAARQLGLPIELVVGVFTILVLAGWVDLARRLPKQGRWATLIASAMGIGAGIGIWALIGPKLLP